MFEVDVNGLTQQYRTKPTMNVDITGSSGSIPKPLTYDYMPEGYPKKDGWSVEWDGKIDGKVSAIGVPFYKFSDMVLSYDEFLSAKSVNPSDPSQFIMVSEMPTGQQKVTDAISMFFAGNIQIYVVSEDNAGASGAIFPTKGLYTNQDTPPFKLIKVTITPMSTDFIPKNFNVVFSASSGVTPDSCNVTYDELRGWIENGIPVFATYKYKYKQDDGSVSSVKNIINFEIDTDSLRVYHGSGANFKYNSDGTISESGVES